MMGAMSRSVLLSMAMIFASALTVFARPQPSDVTERPDLEQMFPRSFDSWRVDDSLVAPLVSPDVKAALDKIYDQTLSRNYVASDGSRIMLSVAYGANQSDMLQVHLPEGCYSGQGFAVSDKVKGLLKTTLGQLPVARLVASKGQRIEPITYWIVIGESVARSDWEMKKAKLAHTLRGQVPDGILIRISSIDRDSERAYDSQARFAQQLMAAMPESNRRKAFGYFQD